MSNLMTVKLRRDLRATWSRFVLMVVAIAISLTVFGAVLFAWAASGREATGAYMDTEPASATIVLDKPLDAAAMATLAAQARTRPDVIAATGRTQFSSDAAVNGEARDIPLQVFVAAADDPMEVATFAPTDTSWPPAPGELLIRRDTLEMLDVAVGDTVTITAPSGETVELRVADTVYDPSLAPSPQEQMGRGYLSAASLPGPGGAAAMDQLKIQVADPGGTAPSRDRDTIAATADEVGAWLGAQGLAVREIQIPTPYAHPHQWQADALLLSLLAGGAVALLLSTILVANMLNTLFTQQIPQIGIMKAIGARSGRIARLYLTMVLLVAAAATLAAVAPAVLLGRLAVANFLGFLGIEPVSVAAPWWTYAVVVTVGLALPPLMALMPLVKTSRTTVRAAIDHHGGGQRPSKATGALARLGRIRRLDRGLLMALRNTIRRPARFVLAVGLLASAGMVFVAGMSLSTGTDAITAEEAEQRVWDVDVQLADPVPVDQVTALVNQVPDVTAADAFMFTPTGVAGPGRIPVTRTYPDQGHGRIAVTALPEDPTLFIRPELAEGRWLNPGETGAVVLNRIALKDTLPDSRAGDTVQLILDGNATTWLVVGVTDQKEGGGGVYATAEGFAAATGRTVRTNQLRIATTGHDEETRAEVADAVNAALTGAGIGVKSSVSVSRSEAISSGHLGPVVLILLAVALPLGAIGLIGLASTMSANILGRTREFGVMHAIGARPKAVRRIVIAEGIFLALASCLVAVIPTLVLTAVLGAGLGNLFFSAPLPYRISLVAVIIWPVLVFLGAVLATEASATRASRITVREALTYL